MICDVMVIYQEVGWQVVVSPRRLQVCFLCRRWSSTRLPLSTPEEHNPFPSAQVGLLFIHKHSIAWPEIKNYLYGWCSPWIYNLCRGNSIWRISNKVYNINTTNLTVVKSSISPSGFQRLGTGIWIQRCCFRSNQTLCWALAATSQSILLEQFPY